MVLLTSSSISLAISTSIICIFTFLLFLSGYVLQQQTVRGLQEALRAPPPPKPTLPPKFQNINIDDDQPDDLEDGDETSSTFEGYDQPGELEGSIGDRVGKEFGHPPGSSGRQKYEQNVLSSEAGVGHGRKARGNKQAYIQLLSNPDPSEVCSAILLFKTLEEAGGGVTSDRLILYPKSWDLEPPSPDMEAAMALLHAPGGGLEINRIPVDVSGGLVSRLVDEELWESSLSLLRQYRSILYLQSPGLIVDPKKLDREFHSKTLDLSSSASDWASPSQWIPTTNPRELSEEANELATPVLFVSSAGPVSQHASLEFYIPSLSSLDFASVPDSQEAEDEADTPEDVEPAYVHFWMQNGEPLDSNSYFRTWRDQRQEMCPDINLMSPS